MFRLGQGLAYEIVCDKLKTLLHVFKKVDLTMKIATELFLQLNRIKWCVIHWIRFRDDKRKILMNPIVKRLVCYSDLVSYV